MLYAALAVACSALAGLRWFGCCLLLLPCRCPWVRALSVLVHDVRGVSAVCYYAYAVCLACALHCVCWYAVGI